MVRVAVIASSYAPAAAVAASLHEDDRFQIVEIGWTDHEIRTIFNAKIVDLIVAVRLDPESLLDCGIPLVCLSDKPVDWRAFSGGVRAWLPEAASVAELGAAIEGAAREFIMLTDEQARKWLVSGPRQSLENAASDALTARELQVLRMLADGLANKEIAGRLNISDHTAKFHVAQILAKLNAASRAEAVAIGIRKGLVPV